jgi:hypothetical protein
MTDRETTMRVTASRLLPAALAVLALSVWPAVAAPRLVPAAAPATLVLPVQDTGKAKAAKAKETGAQKGKASDQQNAARSNKSGATRGKERADQVQGMQDSGKGPTKRQ